MSRFRSIYAASRECHGGRNIECGKDRDDSRQELPYIEITDGTIHVNDQRERPACMFTEDGLV